jgi:hypothetical protein
MLTIAIPSRTLPRALLAGVLGCVATAVIVVVLDRLPSASFLLTPGDLLAAVIYPQGIHTGSGAPSWFYLLLFFNALFYSALWFGFFEVLAEIRKNGTSPLRKRLPPEDD